MNGLGMPVPPAGKSRNTFVAQIFSNRGKCGALIPHPVNGGNDVVLGVMGAGGITACCRLHIQPDFACVP